MERPHEAAQGLLALFTWILADGEEQQHAADRGDRSVGTAVDQLAQPLTGRSALVPAGEDVHAAPQRRIIEPEPEPGERADVARVRLRRVLAKVEAGVIRRRERASAGQLGFDGRHRYASAPVSRMVFASS